MFVVLPAVAPFLQDGVYEIIWREIASVGIAISWHFEGDCQVEQCIDEEFL